VLTDVQSNHSMKETEKLVTAAAQSAARCFESQDKWAYRDERDKNDCSNRAKTPARNALRKVMPGIKSTSDVSKEFVKKSQELDYDAYVSIKASMERFCEANVRGRDKVRAAKTDEERNEAEAEMRRTKQEQESQLAIISDRITEEITTVGKEKAMKREEVGRRVSMWNNRPSEASLRYQYS
jgi:hypothetical protein